MSDWTWAQTIVAALLGFRFALIPVVIGAWLGFWVAKKNVVSSSEMIGSASNWGFWTILLWALVAGGFWG